MLKIAVIGVGSMGQNHARVYANLDGVELVAVSDANLEQVEKVSKRCHAQPYLDYKEMLERENIDAVSVAVPTSLHKEVTLYVLNRGKHVLLEKPIAATEEEAREIIACAERNNVKLMIGHIERFNPAVLELKRRLSQGDLGDIYKIDVQRIGPFPPRITDVGVIIDLSVHDLDIIDYLTNAVPTRVYAETQQRLHPHNEDSVTALIHYDNDVLATLNINYLSPTKTRLLKVFGKKGMFKVDHLSQELYFYENKSFSSDSWNSVSEGDMRKINIPKKEPLLAEIEAFIQSITSGSKPPVGGHDGIKVLRIANMLMESSHNKRIIEPKSELKLEDRQ
jgi:UDP-N-acetylglucosamine 3-dehydrogenase